MKTRDGIYQSDFYLSDGRRIRESLKTRDRAEAKTREEDLRIRMEAEIRGLSVQSPAPAPKAPPALTLQAAYKRAKREHGKWRDSKSPETIEGNYNAVSAHFGETRLLATIDRKATLEYAQKLQDQGKSPSTINQRLSLISILLKYAEDWTDGAITSRKMPRRADRKGRIRTLSRAEEAQVIRWFEQNLERSPKHGTMAALVPFLADTGFRIGEALRLRSVEVDWERGLVPAWENKADHPRLVPMTERVRGILHARKDMDEPFSEVNTDTADDRWEQMRTGLKINAKRDPEFVIHALRHTCASRLAAAGMDAFRIQKWMGHKSIATTMRYVTLFGPDLNELALALDRTRIEHNGKAILQSPSMPINVPTSPLLGPPTGLEVDPQGADLEGERPDEQPDAPVSDRLLIRRSLVRAQVGEPDSLRDSEKATEELPESVPKTVPKR